LEQIAKSSNAFNWTPLHKSSPKFSRLVIGHYNYSRPGKPSDRSTESVTNVCSIRTASFSHDGKWLAFTSDDPNIIKLFSTAGDQPALELRGHVTQVSALAFSKDSQFLSAVAFDGHWKTWNIAAATRAEPTRSIPATPIVYRFVTEFSNDGRLIATVPNLDSPRPASSTVTSIPNIVTLRDDSGGELFQTAELIGRINWLKFSADGRRLAARAGGPNGEAQITVWDTASGLERLSIRLPKSYSAPAALCPDGSRLAVRVISVTGSGAKNTIQTWDVDTRHISWESDSVDGQLTELKFSPNGRRILGLRTTGPMLWEAEMGRLLWESADADLISSMEFSADSTQLYGYSRQKRIIQFLDVDTGRELRNIILNSSERSSFDKLVLSSGTPAHSFEPLTTCLTTIEYSAIDLTMLIIARTLERMPETSIVESPA